jgi:nitrogen fixation protein NifB
MKTIAATPTINHPCYDEKGHFKIARVHLPVALKCNIGCNYCDRKIEPYSEKIRPGWTSEILKPAEAVNRIKMIRKKYPNLEVVGVAGPGEPLFNQETFDTFELVGEKFPEMKKCVCTNGLLLSSSIHELRRLKVDHITVTINAITPEIGAKIYRFVRYEGKIYEGIQGSKLLIEKQLEGVSAAAEIGAIIKINTVFIPEINMGDILKVARSIQERGAHIMNIIPLIPAGNFQDIPATSCDDLNYARNLCEEIIPQFRKCKQCRADACGVPGFE